MTKLLDYLSEHSLHLMHKQFHLNIEVSYVMFGKMSKFLNWGATGLGINMLAQTTYNVNIRINIVI